MRDRGNKEWLRYKFLYVFTWCVQGVTNPRHWEEGAAYLRWWFLERQVVMCGSCSHVQGRGGSLGSPGLLCAAECPLMGNGEETGMCCWNEIFIRKVAKESIDSAGLKKTALSQPSWIYMCAFAFAICYPGYWTVQVCYEPALLESLHVIIIINTEWDCRKMLRKLRFSSTSLIMIPLCLKYWGDQKIYSTWVFLWIWILVTIYKKPDLATFKWILQVNHTDANSRRNYCQKWNC